MQWQSWSDFWHMGGNAAFVWGSYGAWLALAAWELWQLRQQRRTTLRQLRRWRKATQGQAWAPAEDNKRHAALPDAAAAAACATDAHSRHDNGRPCAPRSPA